MRPPSNRMENEALANVIDHCQNCKKMMEAIKKGEGNFDLTELRNRCIHCKKGNKGIFKADAIYTAITLYNNIESKRNKGKKATANKRYGHAVKSLREQGKSLREIANTLDIAVNTVRAILKTSSEDAEE